MRAKMSVPRQARDTVMIWPIPEEMTQEEALKLGQELADWGVHFRSEEGYIRRFYVKDGTMYMEWEREFGSINDRGLGMESVRCNCNGKYVVFNPYTQEVSVLCKEAVDDFYKLMPGERWES